MRKVRLAVACIALPIAASAVQAEQPASFKPVTDASLNNPNPGDWPMWRRTYDSAGYSPLNQIDRTNVSKLELVWSYALAPGDRNEPSPIVVNGIMYLSAPKGVTLAINAATGDLIWEHRRKLPDNVWMTSLRNVSVYGDMVYVATGDAHLIALDAQTGKVRWDTQVADSAKGYGYTSGPLVVKGKLITGMAGCTHFNEEGCFITAHDAQTGKELWRTSTIARPGEPGGDSWGNLPMDRRSGGESWLPCSYDSKIDLVYCGVAQAKPWAAASRGLTVNDAALYTSSTLALNPETGKIVWYHQYVPGETLDMDENHVNVLVDRGKQKSLLQFGKHGVLWKIDREKGKYLDHKELVYQNIFESIDAKSGAIKYNPAMIPEIGKEVLPCPSHANLSWVPTSYNPVAGLLFTSIARSCIKFNALEVESGFGKGGEGGYRSMQPMPGFKDVGELAAVNVDTMEKKWSIQQRAPFVSGVLSTEGGLVFAGDYNRYFKAFDSQTGKLLWQSRLPSAAGGIATTFRADGKQYVAVVTGNSSIAGLLAPLTPEIKTPPSGNAVFVFALPGKADGAPVGKHH